MEKELERSFSAPEVELLAVESAAELVNRAIAPQVSQPVGRSEDRAAAESASEDFAPSQNAAAVESPFRRPAILTGSYPTGLQSPELSSPDIASPLGTPSPSGNRRKDFAPAVMNSMELRLQGPFHGSTVLPAVRDSIEPRAPATVYSKRSRYRSFEAAKIQVDKDLRNFKRDALILQKSETASGIPQENSVIENLVDVVNQCLEEDVTIFKGTIQIVVDTLEVMRKQCSISSHKALVTRLLFILTRCSRLVLTEENGAHSEGHSANMYGTLPRGAMSDRWRRVAGFAPFSTRKTAGIQKQTGSPRSPVSRSLTLPSRALRDMVSGFQHLKVNNGRDKPAALCPLTESPLTPSKSTASSGDLDSLHYGSPVSYLGGGPMHHSIKRSPLGRNVVTALEAELDQVARARATPSLHDPTADPNAEQSASPSTPQSAFNKHNHTGKRDRSLGLMAGFNRLKKRFSRGKGQSGEAGPPFSFDEDSSSTSERPDSPSSPSTPVRSSQDPPTTALRPQHQTTGQAEEQRLRAMRYPSPLSSPERQQVLFGRTAVKAGQATQIVRDTPPSEASASTVSPRDATAEQEGLRVRTGARGRESSLESWKHSPRYMKASVSMQSPRCMEHVVCRICEEQVVVEQMEEHSRLCSCLDEIIGEDLGLDACLTCLAHSVEQHAEEVMSARGISEGPLPDDVEEMDTLIVCSRTAAALQPDSTADPAQRCQDVLRQVEVMLEGPDMSYTRLHVDVELFAKRARRLIAAKLEELHSFLPRRREGDAASDVSESTPPNVVASTASFGSMDITDFKLLKPISRGSFGRVYLCEKKATKDYYAIKVMRKADLLRKNMVNNVRNERNILAMTNNPFVVSFYYSFTNVNNLYIVMEYCNGGDCYNLLKSLGCMDEDVARLYIAETILALEYCHTKGIVHRDLKPDNLLISADGHIKLTDFGLSTIGFVDSSNNIDGGTVAMDTDSGQSTPRSMSASTASSPRRWSSQQQLDLLRPHSADSRRTSGRMQRSSTTVHRPSDTGSELGMERVVVSKEEAQRAVGTPDYLAPELLLGTGHGPEVDWWALGAILYEFVTGVPPFTADTPEAIFENILNRNIEWPKDPGSELSPECKDLIDKLLNPDPEKRLGHRGAGEIKLHPFFQAQPGTSNKGINWKELVSQKAAFIPSSESKKAPSIYFEEKPFSKRSMELDTQSERDDLSRRATAAPSPAGSHHSRRSSRSKGGRSRRVVQFPQDEAVERIASRTSLASSMSVTSGASQAMPSPGPSMRAGDAELRMQNVAESAPSMQASVPALSIAEGTDTGALSPTSLSEAGSSSCLSGGSPPAQHRDREDLPDDESVLEPNNQFMNWSYKNVELLGERNREMAEQFAGLRTELGSNSSKSEQ